MMSKPKIECGNQDNDGEDVETDLNHGEQLLREIEEISKALYLHNTPFKASFSPIHSRSKSAGKARLPKSEVNLTPRFLREDLFHGDKKLLSSGWNWKKPLKALSHIGSQKFMCCFSLHVHSIEGLPSSFNGVRLSVHWKRKNSNAQTCPSRVFQGVAEFDESLSRRCVVYGNRAVGSHTVKYHSKRFLIYASIVGAPEHDIGTHQVDLTRLLPRTLDELWGNKSLGKWSTTFKLVGKAVGATLNVSFGYQMMKDELMGFGGDNANVVNLVNLETGSSSSDNVGGFSPNNRDIKLWQAFQHEQQHNESGSTHSDDVMLSQEALPSSGSGFSKSITCLYQKLDESNFHNSAWSESEHLGSPISQFLMKSESFQESNLYKSDDTEFSISEQGVETLEGDSWKLDQTGIKIVDVPIVEIIDADEIIKDDDTFVDTNTRCDPVDTACASYVNRTMADNNKHKCSISCVDLPYMKIEDSVSETSEFLSQEQYLGVKSNYKAHKMAKKSHSLDDVIDSVANDFLNMLSVDSDSFGSCCDGDPQSAREKLLRQFEKEDLGSGNFSFDFDANEEELGKDTLGNSCEDCDKDSDLSLIIQAAEEEYEKVNQSLIQRRKAKILEDLETDSLMQQWGLNERDFRNSPTTWSGGFGSPIELSDEEPSILPSIGEGLGSFVQTRGGGFLRSLHPSLFKNAKNCGNLIIQASNPVVLPAKMGNDILEILMHMASAGVEELYDQIYKLMPLENITGKSIKHIVSGATTNTRAPGRMESWQHDLFEEFPCSYLTDEDKGLDTMSLDAIAAMAINKIEALLIEGLRIQSGMSNETAPSYIHSQYTNIPSFGSKRANLRGSPTLERVAKLQLEDSGETSNDVDGLMGLSITLDQWLRLDSGIVEGDQNLEQITKILKVHYSKIIDNEELKHVMDNAKTYGRNCGLFGNDMTVSFAIQHRDPLRNYEPVGVPMLVLTQIERVHIHAMENDQPMLNETSSKNTENANIDDETPQFRFRIKEIHLAGVLTKSGNRQVWGTAAQKQSGLRWLLASGMASSVKHSVSKSMSIVRSSLLLTNKLMNQDILWSISCVNNNMENNGHTRNPDIIFRN